MSAGAGIGSGIGGLVGGVVALAMQGKGGADMAKEALKAIKKLKESDFDYRALSAPELRLLGQYSPQLYTAIVPEEMQGIQDSPGMRDSQVKSLGTMEEIRDQGDTLADRLGTERSNKELLGSASSANESVLRNLAARGQLGGGDELQARLGANQGIQNNAADMASNLAEQRALRKMSGAQGAAGLAGDIRGSDVNTQQLNHAYMERLNALSSGRQNDAAAANAAAQTGAQAANTQNRQRIGDSNTLLNYQNQQSNLNRQNDLKSKAFQERAQKAGMLAGAYGNYGAALDQKNQQQAAAIQGIGSGVGGAAGGLFGFAALFAASLLHLLQ